MPANTATAPTGALVRSTNRSFVCSLGSGGAPRRYRPGGERGDPGRRFQVLRAIVEPYHRSGQDHFLEAPDHNDLQDLEADRLQRRQQAFFRAQANHGVKGTLVDIYG